MGKIAPTTLSWHSQLQLAATQDVHDSVTSGSSVPTGHPLSFAEHRTPEGLWPFPTSKKPSRIPRRPDTRWQRRRDLAVLFRFGHEDISQSRITVPHVSKRGLHLNIEFLPPKSPNFKAPRSEEQISYLFSQFYNFKVCILNLLMRAIYTSRPWGRNVIILFMCVQTV